MSIQETEIINILSFIASEGKDNPNLWSILEDEAISFPLAFAIRYGFAVPTNKGIEAMTETYEYLVGAAEEYELEDVLELVNVEEKIPPRPTVIAIHPDGTFS